MRLGDFVDILTEGKTRRSILVDVPARVPSTKATVEGGGDFSKSFRKFREALISPPPTRALAPCVEKLGYMEKSGVGGDGCERGDPLKHIDYLLCNDRCVPAEVFSDLPLRSSYEFKHIASNMSSSTDDTQKKGFTCDRIETAFNADDMPAHDIIEAERQLSVFANAKKHWRVLLICKTLDMHLNTLY